MKRFRLALAMLALCALMGAAVMLGSDYAPVVQPCPEDIEAIWAIEDARKESAQPLVTALENDGMPLAYDRESNTFYCTLGLGQTEAWPQLHLTAPDAKGVRLMFADDYTYDWCADAICEGYAYQLLAYTDEAFSYAQVVFTGLPLVMIGCGEEIGDLDVPMQAAVSAYGHEPVVSAGNVHLRGNGSKDNEKKNLKLEFTRGRGGKRSRVQLPGFGLRDEILLNPMAFDTLLVRDRLSWAVYAEMLPEDYAGGFAERKTAYAEVFLNDEYYGVYLMMEPMDEADELALEGRLHPVTDSVYRTLPARNIEAHRPVLAKPGSDGTVFELRYAPAGAEPFRAMDAYLELLTETDDEAFIRKAEACVDIESVVRYALLTQAAGLTDNGNNNAYIWARHDQGGMRYVFAPWDMDMSWGQAWGDVSLKLGEQYDAWRAFQLLDRIIALNVGGAADLTAARWRQWREDIFTTERIVVLMQGYFTELSESGALVRNAQRWGLDADTEGNAVIEFADLRFDALDRAAAIIENRGGEIPAFLRRVNEDLNCYPIDVTEDEM